jgi:hypothetical protein
MQRRQFIALLGRGYVAASGACAWYSCGECLPQNKTGPPVGRAGVSSPLGLQIQVNRDTRPGERQSYASLPRECVAGSSFPRNFTGYGSGHAKIVQLTITFPRRTNLVTSILFAMSFDLT